MYAMYCIIVIVRSGQVYGYRMNNIVVIVSELWPQIVHRDDIL